MSTTSETTTWPELAEGLYGFLTGRGAAIEYAFQDLELYVPSSTKPDAQQAKWKINGTLKIRTSERS
jgi:D-alanyl-D-alanine carboxypeptidase